MQATLPKTLRDKGILYLVAKNPFMTPIYPEQLFSPEVHSQRQSFVTSVTNRYSSVKDLQSLFLIFRWTEFAKPANYCF